MQPPHPCLVTGEAEAKVTLNELALRVLLRGRKSEIGLALSVVLSEHLVGSKSQQDQSAMSESVGWCLGR